jgi:NADH-quinone oxidoreductase subunit N
MASAHLYSIPIAILGLTGLAVLVFFSDRQADGRGRAAWPTFAGVLSALLSLVWIRSGVGDASAMEGMLRCDGVSALGSALVLLAGLATIPVLRASLQRSGDEHAEIFALLAFALAGMLVMMMTHHLVIFFLGLETMSLSLYVLSGSLRGDLRSTEAGAKYLLTGAFASGILLMGLAFLYGASGSFHLDEIARWIIEHLRQQASISDDSGLGTLAVVGFLLTLVGLAFKLGLAPFHQWAPDVYEGAPTPITGFMATAVKVSVVVALVPIIACHWMVGTSHQALTLGTLAGLTIVIGNLGALAQDSVKRMLAWSSLSHGGYIVLALASASAAELKGGEAVAGFFRNIDPVLVYLVAYTVMNVGAFAVLSALESGESRSVTLSDLGGLRTRSPMLAGSMLVFLLSLGGIPLTVGFLAKFGIFKSLLSLPDMFATMKIVLLAILGLGSVLGFAYYLRVIVAMFMRPSPESAPVRVSVSPIVLTVVVMCAVLTVWLGFGPNIFGFGAQGLIDWAHSALPHR